MQHFPPLLRGHLKRRYKRFLADVQLLDGRDITAYCPNTGSLQGLAQEGREVALYYEPSSRRKLSYTWLLSRAFPSRAWVNIHTGQTNAFVEGLLLRYRTALRGYQEVKREVSVQGGRLDFCLSSPGKPLCYVEVKSVSLSRQFGLAEFPDSPTVRGQKHLRMLMALGEGARVVVLFLVQRGDCTAFRVAKDIDPVYGELFQEGRQRGVEVLVYDCEVSLKSMGFKGALALEH